MTVIYGLSFIRSLVGSPPFFTFIGIGLLTNFLFVLLTFFAYPRAVSRPIGWYMLLGPPYRTRPQGAGTFSQLLVPIPEEFRENLPT